MLKNEKQITRDTLLDEVASKIPQGYRFATVTCVDLGDAFDIIYHFEKNYELSNLRLKLGKRETLPSISKMIFAAVIVENEMKDLFGIDVTGMAIDFKGRLLLSEGAPVAPQRKPEPQAQPAQGEGK